MSVGGARGPLQSVLGQWVVLGLGALGILGNDDVSTSILKGAKFAFQLPSSSSNSLGDQRTPIVIHNMTGTTAAVGHGYVWSIIQLTIGAGVCWGSYVVFSSCLPEAVKEMLPVTRKVFDQAVTSLGKGIVNVRDVLTEQILGLTEKQEELRSKQDETHSQVLEIKNDLGDVKLDLGSIYDSIQRCESSLSEAEKRQSYTARGVRLLVRCVSAIMPANAMFLAELDKFSMAGDELHNEQQPQLQQQQQQQHLLAQPEKLEQQRLLYSGKQCDSPQQYTPIPQSKDLTATPRGAPPESERHSSSLPKQHGLDDYRAMLELMKGIESDTRRNVVTVQS